MFIGMSAWQLLLWVAALVMILIPLLIILFNGISVGYFKAKEMFIGHILKSIAGTLEVISKEKKNAASKVDPQLVLKIFEELRKKKEEEKQ